MNNHLYAKLEESLWNIGVPLWSNSRLLADHRESHGEEPTICKTALLQHLTEPLAQLQVGLVLGALQELLHLVLARGELGLLPHGLGWLRLLRGENTQHGHSERRQRGGQKGPAPLGKPGSPVSTTPLFQFVGEKCSGAWSSQANLYFAQLSILLLL